MNYKLPNLRKSSDRILLYLSPVRVRPRTGLILAWENISRRARIATSAINYRYSFSPARIDRSFVDCYIFCVSPQFPIVAFIFLRACARIATYYYSVYFRYFACKLFSGRPRGAVGQQCTAMDVVTSYIICCTVIIHTGLGSCACKRANLLSAIIFINSFLCRNDLFFINLI